MADFMLLVHRCCRLGSNTKDVIRGNVGLKTDGRARQVDRCDKDSFFLSEAVGRSWICVDVHRRTLNS